MDKRKIKILSSNIIDNNEEQYIHPSSLSLVQYTQNNNELFTLTKYYILNNKIENIKKINNNLKSKLNIDDTKYMLTPSVILSSESILQLYKIESIDDLTETINNFITNNKNLNTINRILNSYIKTNLDDLKKNNKIIYKIIIDLFDHYFSNLEINDNKKILDYIKLWFNNKNNNDFNFDLLFDIKKFLN
jgi:hypothetical protein